MMTPAVTRVVSSLELVRSRLFSLPQEGKMDMKQLTDEDKRYCLHNPLLSFFDTFTCVHGVPAYLIVGAQAESSGESSTPTPDVETCKDETKDVEKRPKTKKGSVFDTPDSETIGVCCFSFDGARFAVCYVSGKVTIWDTDHGKQLRHVFIEGGSISNASFLGEESSVLVIYTKNYTCWRWDVDKENSKPLKIRDRVVLSGTNGVIISQRSNFYENGTKLVLATIINAQSGPVLEVASRDTKSYLSDNRPRFSNSVLIQESFVVSKTSVALDGKGVLVGLVDKELEDSYCMLWPNFAEDPTTCKKLDKGTIGTWCNDSRHVVTWITTNKPDLEDEDENSAFIWNVPKMREHMNDSERAFKPRKITNPFGDKVLWCHVTQDMSEKDQLIMGMSGESIRFLFWDIETKTHTHTIETGTSAKDMMLCNKEAWIESYINQKSVKGLHPMEVTQDGSKFGGVLGMPSQVVIWDTCLGVEVLKVSPKDLQANRFKGGTDLMASPSNRKFAIVGNTGVMVSCPPAQSDDKSEKKGPLEAQMVQFENPGTFRSNIASYKMSFSGDGDSLGVLCVGSSKMQVYNLPQGTSCTIWSNAQKEDGAHIQDFCLSNNGKYLVIYIGNQVQIMDCAAKRVSQMIGAIKIDSTIVSMGIKDEASELVLCMEDGTICWYKLSHEGIHFDDEIAPSTPMLLNLKLKDFR